MAQKWIRQKDGTFLPANTTVKSTKKRWKMKEDGTFEAWKDDTSGTITTGIAQKQETLSYTEETARQKAEENIISKYGTYEQFTTSHENDFSKGLPGLRDNASEEFYENLILDEKNRLLSGSDYYGLTNKTYQEYLDNLSKNAKEQKQYDWLEQQKKNLEAMSDENVRRLVADYVKGDSNILEYMKKHDANHSLELLGYSEDEVESMADTYEREKNASYSNSMMELADKLTDSGALGKIGAHLLSIGAGLASVPAILTDSGTVIKERITGEYEPLDTNNYSHMSGAWKEQARGNIENDIVQREEYAEKGEDAPVWREGLGMLYQGGSSAVDSLLMAPIPGSMAIMGAEAAGSTSRDVFNRTGSNEKALATGTTAGGIEAVTEKMGLDNLWDIMKGSGKAAMRSTLANILAQSGIEAVEESTSETLNILADWIINQADSNIELNAQSYIDSGMTEKEAWTTVLKDSFKQVLKAGATGAIGGGLGGSLGGSIASVLNPNKLTTNEETVVDTITNERIQETEKETGKKLSAREKSKIRSEVEAEMDRGYLDIDKMESILGGESYNTYKSATDSLEEYNRLNRIKTGELTGEQSDRLAELKEQVKSGKLSAEQNNKLKEQLSQTVRELTLNDRLAESYNEKGRRSVVFEADLSKYDTKQQATIQKAMESGILNNTNRTHEFVDMIAKLSADKGVSFDFTNNQKLKESGFALEGKTVNGYVQGENITLNINSAKALNKVVGHEITHVLEGTELYTELQNTIIEYAKAKGDYDARWESIVQLYRKQFEGQENEARLAQYKAELTADLVGDYLFSDTDFVNKLSAEKPSIFKKIFDEIKYLCKVATAGSKEAKELEKVKRAFEKAYKENANFDSKIKLSTSEVIDLSMDTELAKKVGGLYGAEKYKKIQEYILEALGNQPINLSDGKQAIVDRSDALHIANKAATKKTAQIARIKELVENAEIYAEDKNVEHNKFNYFCYYKADVRFGEEVFPIYLNVGKSINDGKYHIYDITNKIRDTADRINGLERPKPNEGYALTNVISNNIISDEQKNATSTYSLSEDSQGRTLSNEQIEYFKDSQVRDENGALKPVYHGTKNDFTVFDINKNKVITFGNGFYFGENQDAVNAYYAGDSGRVLETYLNITNPFVIEQSQLKDIDSVPNVVMETLGIENVTKDSIMQDLRAHGYDGIHYKNGMKGNDVFVAFDSSQIKSVDNTNPTSNPDINMSLSNVNEDLPIRSDLNRNDTYGSDIELDIPIRDDIAPVQERVDVGDIPIRDDIPTQSSKGGVWDMSEESMEDYMAKGNPEDNYAPTQENYPSKKIETVKDRNAAKLQNLKVELKNDKELREKVHSSYNNEIWELQDGISRIEKLQKESYASFNEKISNLQEEYEGKENKNTKAANEILQKIERTKQSRKAVQVDYENQIYDLKKKIEDVKLKRDNTDAKYEKSISDLKGRIDKMSTPQFKTAEQRMTKQQEYRAQMSELMGDTSTWVDKKMGLAYKVNTLRRNLRDIVKDENGNADIAKADAIYDEIQGKYNQHEALLNKEANAIKQVYKELKINKIEDAYIQMLGEYRHNPDTTILATDLAEFYNKHKDKIDTAKCDKVIDSARELYDELFRRVNVVLKEQGMQEIGYRKGYFPHFTEEKQSTLAKIFNWKTQSNDIPTDIAGMTEMFNPDRSWQSFNKHRTGDSTDYSFMKGLDNYVRGSLDWIYHIEDIQKRRAFENEIRYRHSEKGIQEKIEAINNNEELSAEEAQEQIDNVYKDAANPLNNFVQDFRTQTNTLAGKKSSMDRGMEEYTNRKFYSTVTNISNRVTANMVAGSVSSALTNFIPITQSWAEVSPVSSLRAMRDTIKSTFMDDGTVDKSDFLTNRLNQNKNLYQTNWDKVTDKVGILMEVVDNFTSQTVWRSKYLENISNGMSENKAIKNADQFAENVMAGRSRGNNPTIFDSKNPFIKTFTAFQLEVANQYGYMFKDLPQEMQNEAKGKLVAGYAKMFLGAYAYNALYSSLTGRDAAFDPIGIIEDLLKDLGLFGEDEEEEPIDTLLNFTDSVLEEVPFVGSWLGGGRIPMSSALPYDGIYEAFTGTAQDLADGDIANLTNEWLNPVFYLGLPVAGGQIRKTTQGLAMFDDDLPIAGSYTSRGKLRYSVEDTPLNKAQAAIFGPWANENAQKYIEQGRTPLDEKQTQELIDLDLPIADYWKYRDGLKGLSSLDEKADYIASLDLPISKKNIMVNNLTDRKEPIDMTDYDLYNSLNEMDYARENPGKYAVSKAVGGYSSFKGYLADLGELKADKDANGKNINGSRKQKVADYINSLDIEYGMKLVLYKSQYPSDNTYNYQIVEYLNRREDISYQDIVTILNELGMTVDANGKVRW